MLSVLILVAALTIVLIVSGWRAFGQHDRSQIERFDEQSPQWQGGKFRNRLPLRNFIWRSLHESFISGRFWKQHNRTPFGEIPVVENDGSVYDTPSSSGLRLTWLGHSTLLLEVGATRLLLDPVLSERASPYTWMGPRRWYQSPLAFENLPEIDAVLISHDHYDHLDMESIELLEQHVDQFVVPLGVSAHLRYWGVSAGKIVELDWWDELAIGDSKVTMTPARHASGRHLFDQDKTLWGGYAIRRGETNVYYSGDTGLFPGLKEIGERLGPFDLTMIETGAYHRNWPDWHLGPEQAVIANQWVKGKRMLPVHWGMFDLALHDWTEPIERVQIAAAQTNLPVLTPRVGQVFEPLIESPAERWWPELSFDPASVHTIQSTQIDSFTESEIRLIKGEAP